MVKPRKETASGPSQRQLRVGELVRKELSDILSRGALNDPDLEGVIITIPEVRMTPDLRMATCMVMPLGGANVDKVVKALNRSVKYFRGQVARRLTMKYSTDLRFVVDSRFDDDDRITRLLNEPAVRRDYALEEDEGDDDAFDGEDHQDKN
ncbi:30S ribosome-binding factor RbfA [Rhodobacteraceae bacterium RKSG542]|uniref:30S ribosome-binding factor RbfA n=1 Tax=Pseudovibrio flavus TaxID=2529854 RepID=UPI0012BD0D6B|nr:30S ribosome-binding factor RbfA [Pseudovibrio flavus]MTI17890.1 30S ribosome-binding factor RbfA [Pseudovibrio flavus]